MLRLRRFVPALRRRLIAIITVRRLSRAGRSPKRIERRLRTPVRDRRRLRRKWRRLSVMRGRISGIRTVIARIVRRLFRVMVLVVVLRRGLVIRLRRAHRSDVLLTSKIGKRVALTDQTRQFSQRIAAVSAVVRRLLKRVARSVTCVVVRHYAFRVRYDRWDEPRLRRFHVIGSEANAFPQAPRRPTAPIQRQLP
jgi:hypothetical protein